MSEDYFIRVPYDLASALRHGEITLPMFNYLVLLHKWANWHTGVADRVSAVLVFRALGGDVDTERTPSVRTIQRAMQACHEAGWCISGHVKGSKKNFPVTITNFAVGGDADGDRKVLNRMGLKHWEETAAYQGGDEDGEKAGNRRGTGGDKASPLESPRAFQENQKEHNNKNPGTTVALAAQRTHAASTNRTTTKSEIDTTGKMGPAKSEEHDWFKKNIESNFGSCSDWEADQVLKAFTDTVEFDCFLAFIHKGGFWKKEIFENPYGDTPLKALLFKLQSDSEKSLLNQFRSWDAKTNRKSEPEGEYGMVEAYNTENEIQPCCGKTFLDCECVKPTPKSDCRLCGGSSRHKFIVPDPSDPKGWRMDMQDCECTAKAYPESGGALA